MVGENISLIKFAKNTKETTKNATYLTLSVLAQLHKQNKLKVIAVKFLKQKLAFCNVQKALSILQQNNIIQYNKFTVIVNENYFKNISDKQISTMLNNSINFFASMLAEKSIMQLFNNVKIDVKEKVTEKAKEIENEIKQAITQ